MLKFNEFLNEQFGEVIAADSRYLEKNADTMNAEFDKLTEKPYQNAPIFLNQLRGCLDKYGMMLPAEATANFLNLSAELVYALGDTDKYLYIVYDTNDDGFVDGYVQVVNADELEALMSMDMEEVIDSDREPVAMRSSTWYAKRDDDSGNDSEYS